MITALKITALCCAALLLSCEKKEVSNAPAEAAVTEDSGGAAPIDETDKAQKTERLLDTANRYVDWFAYDEAIAVYSEILQLDPNFAGAYGGRSRAYHAKGDLDRAMEDFNTFIRLDPNFAEAFNKRWGEGWTAVFVKEVFIRAIADCTRTIQLDPNDAGAYYYRGNAYFDKGEYDRAIADFNQALRVNPNYADAYFNRGVAYNDKEDYARARADWEKALQIDPNDGEARDNLESLRRMGYLTPVPEEVNNAYINASDNVLIGIGTYKIGADTSKMNTGMIFAQTRAKADISRQLDAIVNIMMTDYAARSEITPEAALSFQERVAQTIARADLRDAKVVMANTDSNGLLWVVMEFNKQAAMAELNQAVAAGKLAVPATAAFDTQRYIDAVFSKNAGGGPVPVGE
jgi:tetratricopeptide (TPR) repeat protein